MNIIEIIEPRGTSEKFCFIDGNCYKLCLNRKTGLVKLDDLTNSAWTAEIQKRLGTQAKIRITMSSSLQVLYLQVFSISKVLL